MNNVKKSFAILTALILLLTFSFPGNTYSLTVRDEEKLSKEFLKMAMQHYSIIKDPFIVDYVNDIGQKIVSVLPPQPFTYHFYVVKDDVYNAFAAPAGHIFINSGLFEAMEYEDELAGILGHEIAHVACRHISTMAERSKKIGLATLTGIALGIFLGMGGGAEAASALTMGSIAAGKSASLAYSRENEMQADQIGLKYLNEAGYSGEHLLSMLKKIRSKTWFGSEEIPTYLNTHPANEERMAYIGTWVEHYEKEDQYLSPKKNPEFDMAHTRLVAIYGEKDMALKKYKTGIDNHPDTPLLHYGYGLVLARTGNLKDSAVHLKIALEKMAFNPLILKDLGRTYFLSGRYEDALNLLTSNTGFEPYDPERYFFIGRSQMMLDRLKDAAFTLGKLIEKNPDYPDAHHFLSETYHKLGRQGESSYYLGIHYKNKGEFRNAEFHLKKALKNLNDPQKKNEIKKILKGLKRQISHNHEPDKR